MCHTRARRNTRHRMDGLWPGSRGASRHPSPRVSAQLGSNASSSLSLSCARARGRTRPGDQYPRILLARSGRLSRLLSGQGRRSIDQQQRQRAEKWERTGLRGCGRGWNDGRSQVEPAAGTGCHIRRDDADVSDDMRICALTPS